MSAKKCPPEFSRTFPDAPRYHQSPVEQLSDREFEVFQLLGQGEGTRQIAHHLHLSIKTVEVHRANIRKKLELGTGAELVHYAIRWNEAQHP